MKRFHRLIGRRRAKKRVIDEEYGMVSYDDSTIERASRIITAVISSMLPVLTIYILNILDTLEKRIGFTAGMTALFAACMAYFTTAKRVEILVATAT